VNGREKAVKIEIFRAFARLVMRARTDCYGLCERDSSPQKDRFCSSHASEGSLVKLFDLIAGSGVALLLHTAPASAEPLVLSPLDCPAPNEVDARVRKILGVAPDVALPERASVLPDGESLRITLRTADARVLGDRQLPVEGDCDAQAAAVAVLLATWLSDVHPEFVGNLPEAPAPAESTESAESAGPPVPDSPPATVEAPVPAPAPAPSSAAHAETVRAVRSEPRWELGFAAGGSLAFKPTASTLLVPLGSLGLRYFPRGAGWGAALSANVSVPRREQLSRGSIRYFRCPLVLGPAFRVRAGSTLVDASLGGVAAWLHIAGTNFQSGSTHDVVVFGGAVSGRLALPQGRLAPFLEVTGVAYQAGQAYVTRGATETSVDLPILELFAVLGGSFRAF
jgi:hypothetical protein